MITKVGMAFVKRAEYDWDKGLKLFQYLDGLDTKAPSFRKAIYDYVGKFYPVGDVTLRSGTKYEVGFTPDRFLHYYDNRINPSPEDFHNLYKWYNHQAPLTLDALLSDKATKITGFSQRNYRPHNIEYEKSLLRRAVNNGLELPHNVAEFLASKKKSLADCKYPFAVYERLPVEGKPPKFNIVSLQTKPLAEIVNHPRILASIEHLPKI